MNFQKIFWNDNWRDSYLFFHMFFPYWGIIGLKEIIKTIDLYNVTCLVCVSFIYYVKHHTTSLHAYLKISSCLSKAEDIYNKHLIYWYF